MLTIPKTRNSIYTFFACCLPSYFLKIKATPGLSNKGLASVTVFDYHCVLKTQHDLTNYSMIERSLRTFYISYIYLYEICMTITSAMTITFGIIY